MINKIYLCIAIVAFVTVGGVSNVMADGAKKQKPPTQEQLDERELEALYGVKVERDRLSRNAVTTATRDRYGDGRVAVFQDNTKSARNLDTNDTIGLELKLFEFK